MRSLTLRLCVSCAFLAVFASVGSASPPHTGIAASYLVRFHPGPWRPPPALASLGMRFDPENGDATITPGAAPADESELRARAEAGVRTAPDGSQHAVVGGAFRRWTVATIDGRGRLVQDCVTSEAAARQRVEAAANEVCR